LKWFRVKFGLKSWVASPWQSDTIFGHLYWGMRYRYGEESLQDFIHSYEEVAPLLLVSNGFPGDLLPRPIVAPLNIDVTRPLEEQRKQFCDYKEARKGRYLTSQDFARAINGETSMLPTESIPFEEKRVTLKNQLNRLTSTTGEEGALYNFEEYYWPEVSIYLKLEDEFVDMARSLFQYIADTGYGKRKSVGYGR